MKTPRHYSYRMKSSSSVKVRKFLNSLPKVALLLIAVILSNASCSRKATLERYLQSGERHFAAAKNDWAEIEYINVLRLSPTNFMANKRLGLIYYAKGSLAQALPFLQTAEQINTNDLEVMEKVAVIYQAAQQNDQARGKAEAILKRDPLHSTALLILANSAMNTEEILSTRSQLQNLWLRATNQAAIPLALGKLHLKQREFDAAQQAFAQAQAIAPSSSEVYLAFASLCWQRHQLESADAAFKQAIQLAQNKCEAQLRHADFKFKIGNADEAKEILTEMTKQAPDYFPAWLYLGKNALIEKDYSGCLVAVNNVLRRDPGNFEALLLSAQVKMIQGKLTEARQILEPLCLRHPRSAQAHYQMALLHLRNHEISKAADNLKHALNLNPDYLEPTLLSAELSMRRGEADRAIHTLKPLLLQNPHLLQGHLVLALAFRMQGMIDEAVAFYKKLVQQHPDNPHASFFLGFALMQQNKLAEARIAFEKTLALTPDDLLATEQLIRIDVEENKMDDALQRLAGLLRKDSKSAGWWFLLGRVHAIRGDQEEAEKAFLKAIGLQPDLRLPYLALSQLYLKSGRQLEALEKLKLNVAKNPEDVAALMQIGLLQESSNDPTNAAETYHRILEINPTFGPALNNLAYLYAEHLQKTDLAYDLARKARQLRPNDPYTTDTLGWIHFKRGEYQLALPLLLESAAKLLQHPEVQFHLGMCHYMQARPEEARAAFEQALSTKIEFPQQKQAEEKLAMLRLVRAKPDPQTVAALEKLITLNPNELMALVLLGKMRVELEDFQEAIQIYERARQINSNAVPVLVELSHLYLQRAGNSTKALEMAKAARALGADDPNLAHTLGRLAYRMGDFGWALSLFQESARKPSDADALSFDLAQVYFALGNIRAAKDALADARFERSPARQKFLQMIACYMNPAQARENESQIQQALQQNHQDLSARMALGKLLEQKGQIEKAKQLYEDLLTKMPECVVAMKELAMLYAERLGEEEKAYELGMKAWEHLADDPELAYSLGRLHFHKGNYAYAVNLFRKSSVQKQDDPMRLYYLGKSYYQLKEKERCKEALQKALALNLKDELAADVRQVLAELN